MFTRTRPVIFASHGCPGLVHRLSQARANRNLTVRGFEEAGTITTAMENAR